MDLAQMIEEKRFLGSEFLLWLWFTEERDDGVHDLGSESVEIFFDDRLQLEAQFAEAETSDLKGGAPARSPEARKALQGGKRVSKARLRLRKGEREWVFEVMGPSFALAGVNTPAILSKGEDEPFFERMFLLEELHDAWRGLYRVFLEERLGSNWDATRDHIAGWIADPDALLN